MRKRSEPTKNYFRVSHEIVETEQFRSLNNATKVLYYTLCKLRNRYTKGSRLHFIRTEKQLVQDSGLGSKTIGRAKKDLIQHGLIVCSNPVRGKRTKWFVTDPEIWENTFK